MPLRDALLDPHTAERYTTLAQCVLALIFGDEPRGWAFEVDTFADDASGLSFLSRSGWTVWDRAWLSLAPLRGGSG